MIRSFGCGVLCIALPSGCDSVARAPVEVDGSSTVFPLTARVEEAFREQGSGAGVSVRISGTTAGLRKLCAGETDVAEASRPIGANELAACRAAGVDFVEVPIAYDGIAVLVHPANDWASSLTTDELRRIWAPAAAGTVVDWNQVRPDFPDRPLHLYGPGPDSGTWDYFTAAIVGREDESRRDFTASEDDEELVRGVAGDEGALGYFGLAYYAEHQDQLKRVAIDDGDPTNGAGPILPSQQTVRDGTYQPLARPLFLYVRASALDRLEVAAFVTFYVGHVGRVAERFGYVPLPDTAYATLAERLRARRTGTVLGGEGPEVGIRIERLLGDPAG